uniref:Uncharacterized protein n=1 Tax=Caenorhabditis japonica TaxID=281687 RepID=A0A8R1J1M2_CAEJA
MPNTIGPSTSNTNGNFVRNPRALEHQARAQTGKSDEVLNEKKDSWYMPLCPCSGLFSWICCPSSEDNGAR